MLCFAPGDDRPPDDAHPHVLALFAYWDERRRGRRYPARRDLDPPLDVPGLLADITLVEVREVPSGSPDPRFVYRLVGTRAAVLLTRDLTGLPVGTGAKVSELPGIMERYRRVADTGVCVYQRTVMQERANDFTRVERLMLPLGADEARVDMIMSLIVRPPSR